MTVNPKSISASVITTAPTKSVTKGVKKIDMGAASTYGRDTIGINSPTHRNTHAEEDLFGTSAVVLTENPNDLLDDIFKTCPTTSASAGEIIQGTNDDDFFNPRGEERDQEFGDFASAFGNPAAATALPTQQPNLTLPSVKKDEFADFGAAFTASDEAIAAVDDNNSSLFNLASSPPSNQQVSNAKPVADLLADLDGLNLATPLPSGKCPRQFYAFLVISRCRMSCRKYSA